MHCTAHALSDSSHLHAIITSRTSLQAVSKPAVNQSIMNVSARIRSQPSMTAALLGMHVAMVVQDVKRHDDPELVVLATDECLFADEGFRSATHPYVCFFPSFCKTPPRVCGLFLFSPIVLRDPAAGLQAVSCDLWTSQRAAAHTSKGPVQCCCRRHL